jgi:hypothetical protein
MNLVFPKALRGLTFERLFAHDMNNFDVRELLPSLFFVIVANGRRPRGRLNDPTQLDAYLDRLVAHERLEGFDDPAGRAVLDRWVRASLIATGRLGKSRGTEQIRYVEPLSLLTYKTGLPRESGRKRRVDLYLYRAMTRALARDGVDQPPAALGKIFRDTFGREVTIGPAPTYDGTYNGAVDVDLHALLALCYLDGFTATPADRREDDLLSQDPAATPALPGVEQAIGEDLLQYVLAYHERISTTALTEGLMTLIDVHLFTGTLKLLSATDGLVRNGDLPPAMRASSAPTPPEVYVDFTRERGSASDELAQACVDRDLEMLGRFFRHLMYLKTLAYLADDRSSLRRRLDGLESPAYLLELVRAAGELQDTAEINLSQVARTTAEESDLELTEIRAHIDEVAARRDDDYVRVFADLLGESQEKNLSSSLQKWFWAVGGLRSDHGLIEGNLVGRRRARYVMSDGLLGVLVQLALIDRSGGLKPRGVQRQVSLADFLQFLHERFGFIIDQPPDFLDGARSRAAARDNLQALKRRLRQMGYFEALSDDFGAQFLRDPQPATESAT